MQIDPQDRQRIVRTLSWLVKDAEHRVNDCRQNVEPGSAGGYSPELKEACALLQELQQGELPLKAAITGTFYSYSEDDCKEAGELLGMKYKQIIEFYLHYGRQGWILGNGLPITDLRLAMWDWHLTNQAGAPSSVGATVAKLQEEGRLST